MSQDNPTRQLAVKFTDDEFHVLNRHARKYKLPIRDFVEYMVRCYINSVQQQDGAK
jgi:hypothetical protein